MGDPRKARKQYKTPSHPWQKNRLIEELDLAITYGLKNKHEIWKMNTILSNITNQSKNLVTAITQQAEKEKEQLLKRLKSQGLLKEDAGFDDILDLTVKHIMERRLETLIVRKNMARSMKQARQLITHEHIKIGEKIVTAPSYLVTVKEEPLIAFSSLSAFSNPEHPERMAKDAVPKKEEKRVEKTDRQKKQDKQRQRREKRGDHERRPMPQVELD